MRASQEFLETSRWRSPVVPPGGSVCRWSGLHRTNRHLESGARLLAQPFGADRFLGRHEGHTGVALHNRRHRLFTLAAAVLMVIDARRRGIKLVGAYILGGIFIAISVASPLPDRPRASRRQSRDNAVGRRRHRPPRRVRGRGGGPDDMGRHGLTDTKNLVGRLGIRPARTQRGVHRPCPSLSSQP